MRILIVLHGALGDVIRALPLLARLRRGAPEARIGWAVEPPSAPLLAGHPWLDEVLVFDRPRGLAALRPFLARVRAARWDVALDLGRSLKSALVARASGAPVRLGFARADGREGGWLLATRRLPAQGSGRSKLEQFLAFGDALGLPPAPVEFGLSASAAEAADAARLTADLDGPVVAACVGSSCPSRRWFPAPTAAVLRALRAAHGTSAVLLGTAADAGFAAATLAAAGGVPVRDLTGQTTLRQLLALLDRAAVAFGPDSGALHLAAALGTPVVSLWGATSAVRSAPFGNEGRVLQGAAPCAPCFLSRCPIGRVCMQSIAAAAVAERVGEVLAA
jgi:lipopolysaccharide heptosyltransferase II